MKEKNENFQKNRWKLKPEDIRTIIRRAIERIETRKPDAWIISPKMKELFTESKLCIYVNKK